MSIIETVAVFAGIPAAVILIVYGLVYAGGARSGSRRYRPGRPFEFTPVWFLAVPERQGPDAPVTLNGRAVTGADRLSLAKGETPGAGEPGPGATGANPPAEGRPDATGGASDRW